jgi:addiction module HigA family antidote
MTAWTRKREPTTPGEILREEFLIPLGMTQKQLADHLGCDVKVINRIVNGRAAVSTEMALKLGAAFRTSPDFWLNAQKAVELYKASKETAELPTPLVRAS